MPSSKRLDSLTDEEVIVLLHDWREVYARKNQILPHEPFETWLILAGRGWGKTRTGAETIREWIEHYPLVHLVGATASDVRDTMIEGPAGIMNIFPANELVNQRPRYEPSKRKVTFHNGAVALCYSAEEPDRLRGPQCYKAWADELAAWKYPETWDQLQMGLRLGDNPQTVVTTTPRPTRLIKALAKEAGTILTKGSSYENKNNLSPKFMRVLRQKYENTTLGRQEIHAEILEDVEGALWRMAMIEANRVQRPPEFVRIGIGVDPSASSKQDSDEAGIIAAGISEDGTGYVLEDRSDILSPDAWARQAIELYHALNADFIVAEKNNGGEMIETIVRGIDRTVNIRTVWASRGKQTRAEPVAALYEQGKVKHVGSLPKLENEMTTWIPGTGMRSPNRIDALVWILTQLMLSSQKLRIHY